MDLQEKRQLDLARQVAKVKDHARPWRAIIALVLAVAAAIVSFTAGDITSEQPLERVIAIAAALVFGLLAVIAVVGFASKSRDVMQPVTGRAHAALVRYTIVLVGSVAVLFITLGLFDVPIDQLLVGGAVTSIILGIAAKQSLGNVFSGLVLLLSHCTASELDAGSVSCGLAGSAGWGKIAVRVCPPAVLDHDPALRVAGPPGAQPGVQGGGDHGPASRGDGAPPSGRPPEAGLGRPGGPGGIGPAAPGRIARRPAGCAWNPAGVASPSPHPPMDVPEPAGSAVGRQGDPRPGAAAGR